MRLLGQKNSINVRKVLWTSAELGIDLQCEDWGSTTRSTGEAEFLAINPKGLVPVLIDGDFILSESNTICRYLAASEQNFDLLPREPNLRAQVETWMDWQATELNNSWRYVFMGRVRNHRDFADIDEQSKSVDAWNASMAILNNHLLNSGDYVCGDTFTLADIVLALSTNRWELTPMDRPSFPALQDWMSRISTRPGFRTYCRTGIA